MKNKQGAIGAATTWIVATIIILFVIILFVYGSYILTKEKQIKGAKFPVFGGNIFYSGSEQMLFAILKTEINGRTAKDLILAGEYNETEANIRSILEKISNSNENWNLYIYENEEAVKKIKMNLETLDVLGSKEASVYLNSNKKIKLFAG